MNDLIFDIKEFALHDGTGLRTTVFFKGCPLSCVWCHNPEGQGFEKEVAKNPAKCKGCGLCSRPCAHPECEGLPFCLHICPENCIKVVGESFSPSELASILLKNEHFLRKGGITFSGGEPLCHVDYIAEVVSHLGNVKTAVETCGHVSSEAILKAESFIDDFYYDIKLIDEGEHIKYTGVSNSLILKNASLLLERNRKLTVRIPLIPGITDTDKNLHGIASFLAPYKDSVKVELIPYNTMTGAKYQSVGRSYCPPFDEKAPINKNTSIFEELNIACAAY